VTHPLAAAHGGVGQPEEVRALARGSLLAAVPPWPVWAGITPLTPSWPDWQVGELIAFLVSDRAAFITGDCIAIDGGRQCLGAR
jgi:enoyl-[acyl-carrier-protein] reductase (NADH)